jgi:uncharacterized protein Smg (DUF494 family)
MEDNIVFVYFRNNEIKAFGLSDSRVNHDDLITAGWKHTATLNPCAWIEHLLNHSKNIKKSVEQLRKV